MTDFQLYKRLWKIYIKPYTKVFVIAILLSIAVSSLTGAIAWLIKPALDKIFIQKDRTMLYIIPAGVLALYFLKGLFAYIRDNVMAYLGQTITTNIRNDVYKKIIFLPVSDYNNFTSGTLSAQVFYEVNVLQRIVAGSIKDTIQQVFTIISLAVVIFSRDWKLAIIAVMVLPLTGLIIKRMGKKIKGLVTRQNNAISDIFGFLNETLSSPRIVKSFRTEEKELENFKKITDFLKSLALKVTRVQAVSAPLMEFIGAIGIAGIILYGGYQVINGVTTTGNFFSFMGALLMFYAPIRSLSTASNNYHMAMVSAQRVFSVLDMTDELEKLYGPGKKDLDGVKGEIKYNNVGFSYGNNGQDTLKGVDLEIKSGEMVAFVGSSGAGKTTIVNLLPRFYETSSGGIYIDGVDIKEYKMASLRENIGLVIQDVMLFNDTVKYNIAYGTEGVSDEDIVNAAKAAYAHDFIMKMENGYDTKLGERGSKLSGGEKQRIAIARAILKDAPILILDEATSALDSESEHIVKKALDNLMEGRTTLVIAHRLSTVRNADKIAVVVDGRIMEIGNHFELIKKEGIYKRLHDMQYFVEEKEAQIPLVNKI